MKTLLYSLLILTSISLIALPDPTLPSAKLQESLNTTSSFVLQALVVGADGEGSAIISGRHIRAGDTIPYKNLTLGIKSISPKGVEFDSGEFIPSSITPLESDGTPILHLEAHNTTIATISQLIADRTGANIVPSVATANTTISLSLRNTTPTAAIEEICRATGLWFRLQNGIIRITTLAEYEESLATFCEEESECFTLRYPNVSEVASIIYGLYPERVSLSLGEPEILDDDKNDISRRFERFNSIAGGGGSSFLKMEATEPSTATTTQRGTLFNDGRVKMLTPTISMTTGEAAKIASREKASGAEAIASYSTQNANIFVTVSRKNSMIMVRTSDKKAMEDIRALIKKLDVPTQMVYLEVKVMETELDDEFNSTFEYEFGHDYRTTSQDSKMAASAGFPGANPLSNEGRNDAFTFKLLTKHIGARIELMEKKGKSHTIATPQLLTANNEVSRLFIGEERPMVKNITSQTISSGETIITVPQTEIEFQAVGTLLLITPTINADKTVTLRLLQENSEIVKNSASIPIYSLNDGGLVQNVPVDIVSSRSITGTFIAMDNQPILVGGLVRETESEIRSGIPILSKIPLLGWLFRSTEKIKVKSELIVYIKPHIIPSQEIK